MGTFCCREMIHFWDIDPWYYIGEKLLCIYIYICHLYGWGLEYCLLLIGYFHYIRWYKQTLIKRDLQYTTVLWCLMAVRSNVVLFYYK